LLDSLLWARAPSRRPRVVVWSRGKRVRSAKKDTGFSMRQDRQARSGSGKSGPAKRWLPLALTLILGIVTGCVSDGFMGSSRLTSHDAVERIVSSGRLRVGTSGVQPPLSMKNPEGKPRTVPTAGKLT
jgi:hypothetical protein